MGFLSHRQKNVPVRPEQKWDYITLNDFKSTSCFTPLAYVYLHFQLALSMAVYAVDTFTAVQLLVFNRWSSEISPTQLISFTASKWIFSVCIILSVINLAYEHLRAQRIMNRGSVAESYLDSLAARLESIRWGKGQGWKRFLVFAELTKSKKGAEYVALFTYFSFQSWIRVLLCSGPRQAVNAMTLLSVYNAQLAVAGGNDVGNTLLDFFSKIRDLAENNTQEAVILSGMIFTLVVWVFSFLSLLLAFFFFIFFLWSYIPSSDGGLSGYCSRKINKRLMKVVSTKVNTAIEEEERRRKKAELRAAQKNGEIPAPEIKATIPDLGPNTKLNRTNTGTTEGGFTMQRNDTMATLPPYTSRPGTSAAVATFELSNLEKQQGRPVPPSRTGTMASVSTMGAQPKGNFSTRAPLLNYAAEPGRSTSPAPSLPQMPEMGDGPNGMNPYSGNNFNFGPPARSATATSARSFANGPNGPSNFGPGGYGGAAAFAPPTRSNTGGSMAFTNASTGNNGYGANGYQNTGTGNGYSNNGNNGSFVAEMPAAEIQRTGSAFGDRSMTPDNFGTGYSNGNASSYNNGNGYASGDNSMYEPSHGQSNSQASNRYTPFQNADNTGRASPAPSGFAPFRPEDQTGRASPAPSAPSFAPNGNGMGPRTMATPMRSATQPVMPGDRSMTPTGTRPNFANFVAPPQRNMTAPMGSSFGGNGGNNGYPHERQNSDDTSYSSYFARPGASASMRGPPGPPRQQTYNNTGNTGNNGSWTNDIESQRGPRY